MNTFIDNTIFFGAAISLLAYEVGLLIRKRFNYAIINPLLFAIVSIIGTLLILDIDYETYNKSAQYISFFLTPSTVCLGVVLYRKLALLKKNIKAIAAGIISGVLASFGSIYLMSELFGLSKQEYVTLIPKSITMAIGMGLSEELGGIVTITVASIVITGIFGNVIAEIVYKYARINEPIAKGLALGTAAHAIGTSKAVELGDTEGAMSSLALVVAGILTVISASFFI